MPYVELRTIDIHSTIILMYFDFYKYIIYTVKSYRDEQTLHILYGR